MPRLAAGHFDSIDIRARTLLRAFCCLQEDDTCELTDLFNQAFQDLRLHVLTDLSVGVFVFLRMRG